MIFKIKKTVSHRYWLEKTIEHAEQIPSQGGSPHPSVKVGAMIVSKKNRILATDVNRFAFGLNAGRSERYEDGARSLWINCAEQMTLMQALKHHRDLSGARMYITLEPCTVCAGLIVESGIKEIIVPESSHQFYDKLKKKWRDSIDVGRSKLKEAGVKVTYVDLSDSDK
ncbi:MAG: hypothetical protein EOM37_01745 [Proteobacteria bacterium]|nr:deaminase [Alphaproteobacteria bacterium]NCC02760.1 hypothetical protein [Pseudomonadota bacterium]